MSNFPQAPETPAKHDVNDVLDLNLVSKVIIKEQLTQMGTSPGNLDTIMTRIEDHSDPELTTAPEILADFLKNAKSTDPANDKAVKMDPALLEQVEKVQAMLTQPQAQLGATVAQPMPAVEQPATKSTVDTENANGPDVKRVNLEDYEQQRKMAEAKKIMMRQAELAQQEQEQQKQNRPQFQMTAGAYAMSAIGRAFDKVFDSKSKEPGPGFNALQASGQGLGMNSINQDPSLLTDRAMDRFEKSAKALTQMKPDADPNLLSKAKTDFLEAAGDANRYVGNEHRGLLSNLAEGKTNEFDAGEKLQERGNRMKNCMEQVENSDVCNADPNFKSTVKTRLEEQMQAIRNLIDSIKEMANHLFGNKPSNAAAPGR